MRVLHAYKVYRPDMEGGIPAVIAQLAQLRHHGDETTILAARNHGPARQFIAEDISVKAVGSLGEISSMPIAPQFPFALHRGALHCDVLALHMPFPLNDLGVALGIPNNVALVVHWHADILGRRAIMPLISPVIRRTLRRADRIVVSHESIMEGSKFLSPHRDKCAIVPYGIEPDYWSSLDEGERQSADDLRRKYPRLLVSMGRLVPYKGYSTLLRALPRIDGHLVIIGQGIEHDALMKLAEKLNVTDRLTLAGFLPRDAMKIHLHAARLFVLPSVTAAEAFGIVQIEAMAAGLPVVNTELPTAVPTIARHEREGLTVPPGAPVALAAAINRLLDEPALASGFGAAGRVRVTEEYSEQVFLTRIRAVYAEALDSRLKQ